MGVPTNGFNPRARDGRETLLLNQVERLAVSIHAPVMDAKAVETKDVDISFVSIHAPVMDAK